MVAYFACDPQGLGPHICKHFNILPICHKGHALVMGLGYW